MCPLGTLELLELRIYEDKKHELTWTDPADDAKRKIELRLDVFEWI